MQLSEWEGVVRLDVRNRRMLFVVVSGIVAVIVVYWLSRVDPAIVNLAIKCRLGRTEDILPALGWASSSTRHIPRWAIAPLFSHKDPHVRFLAYRTWWNQHRNDKNIRERILLGLWDEDLAVRREAVCSITDGLVNEATAGEMLGGIALFSPEPELRIGAIVGLRHLAVSNQACRQVIEKVVTIMEEPYATLLRHRPSGVTSPPFTNGSTHVSGPQTTNETGRAKE